VWTRNSRCVEDCSLGGIVFSAGFLFETYCTRPLMQLECSKHQDSAKSATNRRGRTVVKPKG
jgi:hypothetical protein